MSKLHEDKEGILNAIRTFHEMSPELHSVAVFWYNPALEITCHRQGWFDEYVEAEIFGNRIFEEEIAHRFETVLYIDGVYRKFADSKSL